MEYVPSGLGVVILLVVLDIHIRVSRILRMMEQNKKSAIG